tara:strand:+ start:576 stop:824 length:249 start_codon:yes stop_codon:yes gene_type:complete
VYEMDDLLPKKVSKEEKIGALIDNAVTKAKEAVGEVLNYNELPVEETVELEGETVDVDRPQKKPAEEKVDPLEGIRPEFGKE